MQKSQYGEDRVKIPMGRFEELVVEEDLVILNSGAATHYHVPTNSYSAVT